MRIDPASGGIYGYGAPAYGRAAAGRPAHAAGPQDRAADEPVLEGEWLRARAYADHVSSRRATAFEEPRSSLAKRAMALYDQGSRPAPGSLVDRYA